MCTQAQQAGPGPADSSFHSADSEAAGPASPRLLIEEVGFSVGRNTVEAKTILSLGSLRFTGKAVGKNGAVQNWQLAAAASVEAIQDYLQQCLLDSPTPRVQLIQVAATTLGIGQEVVYAKVRFAHGSDQVDLLGAALVRNDQSSTAVAAALDATSRCISRFRPHSSTHLTGEPTSNLVDAVLEEKPPEVTVPAAEQQLDSSSTTAPVVTPPDPQISLRPDRTTSPLALGIEISPTSVRAAAVDRSGRRLAESRRPSGAAADPDVTLAAALDAARDALSDLNSSGDRVTAVGLAVPSSLGLDDEIGGDPSELTSARGAELTTPFAEEFGLPVTLLGNSQAAAFAETRFGAAEGLSNIIFIRVGAAIDVAVIADGAPFSPGRAAPGRGGHMVIDVGGPRCTCGESGCWQVLANRDSLLVRAVRAIRRGTPSAIGAAVDNRLGAVTPGLVCRMAAGGDAVARAALEETGRYLALGIANLIALFDPEALIVDSSPAQLGPALLRAAAAALKASPRAQLLSRCVLLSPKLGDSAAVLGAAAWADRHLT